jgi:ankyrin repeat protein
MPRVYHSFLQLEQLFLLPLYSDNGTTPLHIAVSNNQLGIVNILLRRGADLHIQDLESGWTPLHYAMYYGFVTIALQLVKSGGILDITEKDPSEMPKKRMNQYVDYDGNSPLDLLSLNLKEELLHNPHVKAEMNTCGDIYTFGKCDYQLGYANGNKGKDPYSHHDNLLLRLSYVSHVSPRRSADETEAGGSPRGTTSLRYKCKQVPLCLCY